MARHHHQAASGDGASTSQRQKARPGTVPLDELRRQKKEGIKKHKHAPSTRRNYASHVKRMRAWVASYGCDDVEDDTDPPDPEFAEAFTGAPNKCSPEALTLYMTFKCIDGHNGKATAEGAYSAMKKEWEE